jgi:beta-N-acetylhexosaminidase
MLATTLAVMKLSEEGKMKLDDKLSQYIPELKSGSKASITISQVLRHKAGFKAWLPFYLETIKDTLLYQKTYSTERKEPFVIEVGKNLYMNKNQIPVLLNTIYKSPLESPGKYVYSDWGMILLRYAIEKASGISMDEYVQRNFYAPMGLSRIGYLPLQRFPESRIVPTEMGRDFRKELIQGYVHDPAAAMFGGVSGHAGLFSNSQDVAALMQMLLNKGMYNGKRYLKAETIVKFTRKQDSDSRRGLGFDKPDLAKPDLSPVSELASPSSFGHTGFTGTLAWADPENQLVFVFLSNRVHPSSDNKRLIQDNVRIAIMDVIYTAISNSKESE